MSEVRRLAAAVGLLIALAPPAPAGDGGREDEMVCVPAADGRSWECGTRANPPPERGLSSLPREPGRAGPPPPFLAAPGTPVAPLSPPAQPRPTPAARDAFPPAPARPATRDRAQVATLADPAPAQVAPLDAPSEAVATAPIDAPAPVSTPPPAPPPLLAAPRPRLAPYAPLTPPTPSAPAPAPVAEPRPVAAAPAAAESAAAEPVAAEPVAAPVAAEPVAAEPVAAEPVAAEPVAAEPVAAEAVPAEPVAAEPVAAEPVATAPVAAAPLDVPALADRDAFLALPPQRATLQLARATRVGELYATWRRMVADSGGALAQGTAYVVTLDAGGTPQALLLWSDFADTAAARAAWEALPGFPAGKPAAYARRIAPLQDEVRRALSNP